MRLQAVLILAMVFLPAGAAAQTDAAKKEMGRLEGTWRLVGREIEGKKATPRELKAADATLILKGAKLAYWSQGAELWQATVKVDPAATPPTLAVTHIKGPTKGKTARAVYKLEGDRLTVCFSYAKLPADFKTEDHADRVLVVYQREKK